VGALGATSVDGMAPLPGTLREVDDIAKVEPGARVVRQGEFTHDAVRHALETYPRVHLATHGLLEEQSPLFSSLLTSPAQGQPSRFSLFEVPQLKLRARLVVLSACETGLGKLRGGDEVTGLTRTLLAAGAETVVSSLWKVSDDSTALLMRGFYSEMKSGASPAKALRTAALAVRERYPHPFYWAPFVVSGVR
jgi:CHAT domain-containing protein